MFDVSTAFRDLMDVKPLNGLTFRPQEMPPWEDGGYHFRFYRDHPYSIFYGEYWYFNFTDHKTGLSGMIAFGAFNPKDWLGQGRFAITTALFSRDNEPSYVQMDSYPVEQLTASEEKAELILQGETLVLAESRDRYRVKAKSRDGRMSVDLLYHQLDRPVLASEDVKGDLDWEFNWWVLTMPGARVEGTVTFDGHVHELQQGAGYHDHSWGIWLLPERIWSWAVCAVPERKISVMLGYMTGFDVSHLYMSVDETRVLFDSRTAKDMTWDFGTKETWEPLSPWLLWPSPTKVSVRAIDASGLFRLEGQWTVTRNGLFVLPSPIPLFEQEALVTASLFQRASTSDSWNLVAELNDVVGHSEFVSRWHRPVRPAGQPR